MTVFAGVAQLVEHHLAKVRVAGSSPVARSERAQVRGHFRAPDSRRAWALQQSCSICAATLTHLRWSSPRRPGDVFEAEKDDEVTRWLELGYVSEVKARRSVKKTARRK
jgi:hypothetical protein